MSKYPRVWTYQSRLQKICISCPESTESCVFSTDIRIPNEKSFGLDEVIVTIKVVNVSKHSVWIDMRILLARIAQYGSFPQAGRFVRHGTRAYREWQTRILEHAQSEQDRLRAERREQAL
ncbi:Aspartic protease [Phytophthora megakarya]|uniref:Aspartic protease n=1 Tax=Phytophthora megakarya TaxID=4795 RepID=A0A225VG08_9STRA|nr:Aspartic protease [Phytophthora megakarya]